MQRTIYKMPVTIFFMIVAIILISTSVFAQLVTNGDFEDSNVGNISGSGVDGWSFPVGAAVSPAPFFEIVDDPVQHGDRALAVTVNGLADNAWDIQAVAEHIPIIPGHEYSYEIWAKAEEAGAQVNFTFGNYSYQQYGAIYSAKLTTEWQKFTMQLDIDDDRTDARAPVHFNIEGNPGNIIYIDNLKVIDSSFGNTPVSIEAEDGDLGSNISVEEDGDVTYVTALENFTGSSAPEDESRIMTYEITFEDSGYYNLFVRLRVGSGSFDDDSFFYGFGFDEKDPTSADDWVFANGLASAGFSSRTDVVDDAGSAGTEVWKWVNVSKNFFDGDAPHDAFWVEPDELDQLFQIATREDGLDIDKIAFGKANLYYYVGALDDGLAGSLTMPNPPQVYPGPQIAKGSSKFLGSVMNRGETFFANYWNQLTPGNAGKWASVAGSADTSKWDWSTLDYFYNYAQENDLIFKDHTLVWGNQQPKWLNDLDPAEQLAYIETWIRLVGERYPDMEMVDVVNEPLKNHNPPDGQNGRANYKQALGGDGETGWDWVIKSFELAREYLPNVELILNDYGIINDNNSTRQYLDVINVLLERNLIDAIGVQGHRFALEGANVSTLKYNLDRLAATGLPIYISELDLGNISNEGTPDDEQQLQLYQKIFPVLWEHPGVKGITLWGYREGNMWQSTCYMVRADGTWRPAMEWLADYVANTDVHVLEHGSAMPVSFQLEQNFPNPFNPATHIRYQIGRTSDVTLKVYDVKGREVATLVNTIQAAGEYTIRFDARNLASGVYFYTLGAGEFRASNKFLLVK